MFGSSCQSNRTIFVSDEEIQEEEWYISPSHDRSGAKDIYPSSGWPGVKHGMDTNDTRDGGACYTNCLILGFDEMLVSGSEWQTAEAPVGLDSVWKFLESSSRYPSLISTT